LKSNQHELTEALIERNRFRDDSATIRNQYESELQRLRREIEQCKLNNLELSNTKGTEVSNIVSRFTNEQQQLELLIQQKQYESDQLRTSFSNIQKQMEMLKSTHFEEISVVQTSLDQALIVLGSFQNQTQNDLGTRDVRITELEAKHNSLLFQMMDNMLFTCITTVKDSIFNFDSPQNGPKCSPEYVLTLIEKTQHACSDFSTSYIKLVNVIFNIFFNM
jgi:hypothetical protein